MKPRIFIGSSKEGLKKAKQLKGYMSDFAECQIWNEGFFENNSSSFESLSQSSTLFDFAIMVATKDDILLKRDKFEISARDNVLFEFGLYVGRLGKSRTFLFKEKGVDIPSDLYGITMPQFSGAISFKSATDEIKERMEEIWGTFELGFTPSTVLALGYFENFVLPVSRELMQSTKRTVEGKDFSDFVLNVIIPDELPNNFQDQVIAYLGKENMREMKVETATRKYNFYLEFDYKNQAILNLFDLPTTLGALKKSIEMAVPSHYVGEKSREQILKKKEMNNFCRTLTYLVKENAITKSKVKIKMVDVN